MERRTSSLYEHFYDKDSGILKEDETVDLFSSDSIEVI